MRDFLRQLAIAVAPVVVKEAAETLRQHIDLKERRRRTEFTARMNKAVDAATEGPPQ